MIVKGSKTDGPTSTTLETWDQGGVAGLAARTAPKANHLPSRFDAPTLRVTVYSVYKRRAETFVNSCKRQNEGELKERRGQSPPASDGHFLATLQLIRYQ